MNKIELCKQWIEQFVINLRLCPFAHYSFYDDTIAYAECKSELFSDSLTEIYVMIDKMQAAGAKAISNSFVIVDDGITFRDLLDLQEELIQWLEDQDLSEVYQTVVFHPKFQFALSAEDDHGNFVNRSPHPMIHILRVEEVSRAIDNTEDAHAIPNRNKALLESLQIRSIDDIYDSAFQQRADELLNS